MDKNLQNKAFVIKRIFYLIKAGEESAVAENKETGINAFWVNDLRRRIEALKADMVIKDGESEPLLRFYEACSDFCNNKLCKKGIFKKYYSFKSEDLNECLEKIEKLWL